MISVNDLNDLMQQQFSLFAWLQEHPELRDTEPSPFDEENRAYIEVQGSAWSYTLLPNEIEFTDRETGKTVLLSRQQQSPFEFNGRGLLRFLLTKYEDSTLTDVVIDNWLMRQVVSGRLTESGYSKDFYALH